MKLKGRYLWKFKYVTKCKFFKSWLGTLWGSCTIYKQISYDTYLLAYIIVDSDYWICDKYVNHVAYNFICLSKNISIKTHRNKISTIASPIVTIRVYQLNSK